MKKRNLSAKKWLLCGMVVLLLGIAAAVTVFLYQKYLDEITPIPVDGLTIEAGIDLRPEAEEYFSYLGNFDPQTAELTYWDQKGQAVDPVIKSIDAEADRMAVSVISTGQYEVRLSSSASPAVYTSLLTVKDTTAPVLQLHDLSLDYGTGYSFGDFVESCTDNASENCTVAFASQNEAGEAVDFSAYKEPGTYTVIITAVDEAGNTASAAASLTIGAKPKPKPEVQSAKLPYSISINRLQNVVTVYTLDEEGAYTVPYKAFICSTGGSKTPAGTFRLGTRYEWLTLVGGVQGQYTVRIHGSIAFHSVPYFTRNKGDLEYEEYNKLGSVASLGCVRMAVQDVKWVYENCAAGTPVTIFDSEEIGPLGKPQAIVIDPANPNRGWDPTDPDPANPWKNG